MLRVRRWMTVTLAGLALAFAAGCGGGDGGGAADAYVDEVNAAQRAFAADVERIDATGDEEAALAAYSAAAEEAAQAMRAIEPPEDVAALHADLVSGFDRFARETARVEQELTSGDLDRVLAAQQRMLEATEAQQRLIRRTVAEINDELQTG